MERFLVFLSIIVLVYAASIPAFACNGANVIGVGATSRAMGGVGVAAPQDAASAVFSNPAALFFGPYSEGSQFDYNLAFLDASVEGKIDLTNLLGAPAVFTEKSDIKPFLVPAIGITSPITHERFKKFRFGIGAFGTSGAANDYKASSKFID